MLFNDVLGIPGINQIYKITLKTKKNSDAEITKELDSLKKRVELLERK